MHGLGGEPANLDPLADALRGRGHAVSIPSLPGSGAAASVRAVEEAALALRHLPRVHLVGLSLGGLLAILAARPTAAATITTINAPVVLRDPTLYARPRSRRIALAGTASPTEVPLRTGLDALRVMARAHAAAARLRRPALVIQARADDVVHPVSAALLARRLGPHSRIMWLPRAGHLPDGEATERIAAAVDDATERAR